MPFALSSPAFTNNALLPVKYTCDGDNVSPPLAWTEVPEGTVELVLVFEDADGPGGTFVQWIVYAIDPTLEGLEEGKIPAGALGGKNDYGRVDWAAPCPPVGRAHRYIFTLLALGQPSGLAEGASARDDLPYALSGKVLGQAQFSGRYARVRGGMTNPGRSSSNAS